MRPPRDASGHWLEVEPTASDRQRHPPQDLGTSYERLYDAGKDTARLPRSPFLSSARGSVGPPQQQQQKHRDQHDRPSARYLHPVVREREAFGIPPPSHPDELIFLGRNVEQSESSGSITSRSSGKSGESSGLSRWGEDVGWVEGEREHRLSLGSKRRSGGGEADGGSGLSVGAETMIRSLKLDSERGMYEVGCALAR